MVRGVDLAGILGAHGQTYYKSPAVKPKRHIFLHCNASNLVLEVLQHDKIWGTIPLLQILGGTCLPSVPSLPPPPVIYAPDHGYRCIARSISNKTVYACVCDRPICRPANSIFFGRFSANENSAVSLANGFG